MDSESALPGTNNDPASAVEALRGEISLLRRAVEGLTAERQGAPNYKPKLAAMAERLAALAHSPAMPRHPQDIKQNARPIAPKNSEDRTMADAVCDKGQPRGQSDRKK